MRILDFFRDLFAPHSESAREAVSQAARGAPAVTGAAYSALTLNEVVAYVTIAYVILQFFYLARKWYREEKGTKK